MQAKRVQEHKARTDLKSPHGSLGSYTIGFILSVVWTALAYVIVTGHLFSSAVAAVFISLLAVAQLITQLVFFLHLGRGRDSKWNVAAFLFMLMVLVIIIGGSLWIMQNLNYNMVSPQDMNQYMKEQNKAGF